MYMRGENDTEEDLFACSHMFKAMSMASSIKRKANKLKFR